MTGHALRQVIVIPRNGYINRMQAWASAAILGASLQVPTRLLWETEPAAPGAAGDFLDLPALGKELISRAEIDSILGCDHEQLPRYLNAYSDRHVLVLAGHDRGEQAFMPELMRTIDQDSSLQVLVIIAGGQFHQPQEQDFDGLRRAFYRSVPWSGHLNARVHELLDQREPFLAVHIRQTDRSRTAPSTHALREAVRRLAEKTGTGSIFVAADTAAARDQWHAITRDLRLVPWSVADQVHDRTSASGAVGAMLDWRILGAAEGLVYSRESSFGHEAATAMGPARPSVGLTASRARQRARSLNALARSAFSYPRRTLVG